MAMSGLGCRKALVGTGRAISVVFGINGLRTYIEPPFPAFMHGPLFDYGRLAFPRGFDSRFVNWCIWLDSCSC